MNPNRMREREAYFSKRELARLPGYRLCMNKLRTDGTGAANIVEDESSEVYGLLYTCTSSNAIKQLDKFESVHQGHYSRKEMTVYLENGEEKIAYVYLGNPTACDDTIDKVRREYLDHLLAGEDLLPAEYVQFLKKFEAIVVD